MRPRGLDRRLRRLEQRPGGLHGPCMECGGRGKLTMVNEHAGETIETVLGCTGCGKIGKVILLKLATEPGGG